MTTSFGLDIGTNSVGSAWVDDADNSITLGVSVFPAGINEKDEPKNKNRRDKRSLRRNIRRRALRKHQLRRLLQDAGLFPTEPGEIDALTQRNPWHLRRDALQRELTPHEFGRVLIHLNQRRGALGVETDPEDKKQGEVKQAIDHLRGEMKRRQAATFGQLMADLYDERRHALPGKANAHYHDAIRNRFDSFEFHADRALIREEFHELYKRQKQHGGTLARLLTDDLQSQLDSDPKPGIWRHEGAIFGQRRTYWNAGTIGRCDLEPTDLRCPMADMYAQEFRVLETVNNIRIEELHQDPRPLDEQERAKVIDALQTQKTGSVATIRRALGINKKGLKERFALNLERDKDREINTDRFQREIVQGVFGQETWAAMTDRQRESVNRAILTFDPDDQQHSDRLTQGAKDWWGLNDEQIERFLDAWRSRARTEKRVKLSRRAIRHLLPALRVGADVSTAKDNFATDPKSPATPEQRVRYALSVTDDLRNLLIDIAGEEEATRLLRLRSLNKADRHYLAKHPDLLPPAPMLSNPVVRKTIHEVRRHVMAYLRKFGRKPDRMIIELAREAKQTAKARSAQLSANRTRKKEYDAIIEQFDLSRLTENRQRNAVDRVRLCRQQREQCAYSGLDGSGEDVTITEAQAADGSGIEVDHIVPLSRSQDNSFNNRVLCRRETNRNKGNQTPKEWLSEAQFATLERRFDHWKKGDLRRKWENLHRDAPKREKFVDSQLTDTAYASKQVGDYLRGALFADETDTTQRIFFTKGLYTAMLRKDWQLQNKDGPKSRDDHRHHAIDAVVIACSTPARVNRLAKDAEWREEHKERTGQTPKRPAIDPPWGEPEAFRAQVMELRDKLVVSHRPAKRKLVGALHQETLYGPVWERAGWSDTLFTSRKTIEQLTSNHLRMPKGWDKVRAKLDNPKLTPGQRKRIRRELAALPDPLPAKSGIVRDRALRDQIRQCLRANKVDPGNFTKKDIDLLAKDGKLQMASGVPIKRIVLLWTNKDPIVIEGKKWDSVTRRYVPEDDPRLVPRRKRVYIGGNNHHIEIREHTKTGKWSGRVIDTYSAATRMRIGKSDAVDRTDDNQQRFVMSLAEGETLHMRHPVSAEPGLFVVFKLDKPSTIHFKNHADARPAGLRKDAEGNDIPGTQREDIPVVAAKLRDLGLEPGKTPYKVRVTPLGEIRPLPHD